MGAKTPDWQNIDAVIFDMDGTLVDSMHYWVTLPQDWFAARNLPVPEDLEVELGTLDLWQASTLLAEQYSPCGETTQQVYDEIQAKMDKHYAEDIPMWPGVKELLQALKAAGKPCCIATMTDRPQVETVLKTHGIGEFFDFVLTTPEVGIGKERPEIFLQAAERLGCAPKRILVVEDSRTAIRTALLAGFAVAVIPNPHYDYAPLSALAADLQADFCFVEEFSNLLPIAKN